MPSNGVGASLCETRTGDILVAWGGGFSYSPVATNIVLSRLWNDRNANDKWRRKDYLDYAVGCYPSIVEDHSGRIFLSCFSLAVSAHRPLAKVYVRGIDEGPFASGISEVSMAFNEADELCFAKRTGQIFMHMTTKFWTVDHNGKTITLAEEKGAIGFSSAAFLPDGALVFVTLDGDILTSPPPFTSALPYAEWPQTRNIYRDHTGVTAVAPDGTVYVAGNSLGAREEGEAEFRWYGVENSHGLMTKDGIGSWYRLKPGLLITRAGYVIMAIPPRLGPSIISDEGRFYAEGIELYISRDGGRIFQRLDHVNEGIEVG